jgi:predicted HicB family RNase H-like nuclease
MIYKNYHAQISYSEEDDVFIGRVVNVERDIIAFDGYSVEELKQAFKTVIDDYLQDCEKAGRQPESPLLEEMAA